MVSHIRYATRGEVKLENVHPFQREMWGIAWVFAHNGDVSYFDRANFATGNDCCMDVVPKMNQQLNSCVKIPWIGDSIGVKDTGERPYNPVGKTDSESLFCAMLNALRARFDTLPTLPVLHDAIASLCDEIVVRDAEVGGNTILNFLLGCGPHIQFAYSWPGARPGSSVWNGLHYLVREPPFGTAHLSDCDYTVDFSAVTKEDDRVAVIATAPLTDDETWVEINRGQLILFDDGLPHKAPNECVDAEYRKHGLESDVIPTALSLEVDMRQYEIIKDFYQGANI
jgi:glutamine amidotransferase